jgi:hypothetical protein
MGVERGMTSLGQLREKAERLEAEAVEARQAYFQAECKEVREAGFTLIAEVNGQPYWESPNGHSYRHDQAVASLGES